MQDIFETMQQVNREWERGRMKRAILDLVEPGAPDSDWYVARDIPTEMNRAPSLPDSELAGS